MSAAVLLQRDDRPEPQHDSADLEVLQDLLYDMLATGITDEHASVSPAQIEGFLHEHAREAKSAADFRAFFERHGLRMDPGTHESAILELPPITTVREPLRLNEGPVELSVTDIEEIPWKIPVPPPVPRGLRWGRASGLAVAALGLALIVVSWRGYIMIHELRTDLSRATETHQRDHTTLEKLSDQATTLESSVAATGELIQRVDQKSDLLLDSLLPAKPQTQSNADHRGN